VHDFAIPWSGVGNLVRIEWLVQIQYAGTDLSPTVLRQVLRRAEEVGPALAFDQSLLILPPQMKKDLLRGFALGLYSLSAFFTTLALALEPWGVAAAFGAAAVAALAAQAVVLAYQSQA
jgi:hypothetical protein